MNDDCSLFYGFFFLNEVIFHFLLIFATIMNRMSTEMRNADAMWR